jgi:hypothetical protein
MENPGIINLATRNLARNRIVTLKVKRKQSTRAWV